MDQGIIITVDFDKGLGYVRDDQGKEIVLIAKGMESTLSQHMPVAFDIRQTRVGLIAVNIQPLSR